MIPLVIMGVCFRDVLHLLCIMYVKVFKTEIKSVIKNVPTQADFKESSVVPNIWHLNMALAQ